MSPASRHLTTYLMLITVVSIWGAYPTLIKIALRDMPPLTIAAFRCTLASAILVGLVWRERSDRQQLLTGGDFVPLCVLGVSGIFSMGVFYLAVALTSASNAVILTATTPVLVAVGGHWFFGDRLRAAQWLGVACSAVGVLLTVTRGALDVFRKPPHPGDGLVLLGQIAWATYTLYGKRILVRMSPRAATAAAYLIGTAMIIPLAILTAPAFEPAVLTSVSAWGVVLFQGTVGTLSHVWYYRGVQTVGPSVTAIFMNLQPLVGVGLATLILGEGVSIPQAAGAAAILVGVWLTTRPART